ncbi:MAG: putative polysaccharide biosynthesis protein [Berkelbacteria bacterium GW2011_GWA1_36_9]|uniref:Putative polysaccharide biosynthesis protein n=1 Tax=Berkelbacteria bacterium GW2011_GWA1_36_9 TaxID=1618331 RepID=A0A0G0FGI7_9BACT|nr:MAG: putative polysaccharide biosynthesis protein [Berkelbacteria bacterium GW2011_GWA1_36_9]
MTVSEFGEMVKRIRKLEKEYGKYSENAIGDLRKKFGQDVKKALGDGVKRPAPHGTKITHPGVKGSFIQKEADERHWARRGLYPKVNIRKGTIITEGMIISLRPDVGISALSLNEVMGKTAGENLPAKLPIKIEHNKIKVFKKVDIDKAYPEESDRNFTKTLKETAFFD